MRAIAALFLTAGLAVAASFAVGQPPDDRPADDRPPGDRPDRRRDGPGFVERLMALDKDQDGKLAKDEVADERLARLFARTDADQDGALTRDELTALESSERETYGGGGFGPARGGPEGFSGPPAAGGPDGFGPQRGGPGGPPGFGPPGGGPMGRPRPGEVLPPPVREMLELTEDQRTQLDELQKDVDARLEKILTPEQLQTLREPRDFGRGGPPGGPGGPGGRGRSRGQGGPPGPPQ